MHVLIETNNDTYSDCETFTVKLLPWLLDTKLLSVHGSAGSDEKFKKLGIDSTIRSASKSSKDDIHKHVPRDGNAVCTGIKV